jgi:hypothetical protein
MSSIIVNQTLTNYARGIAQDMSASLADFIAPWAPVGVASGQYKEFGDTDAFIAYETARALGTGGRRIAFTATDKTFFCKPNSLEIGIDDAEREQAGKGDPLALEQAKIRLLVGQSRKSREAAVFAAIAASVSAADGVGSWSANTNGVSTNDPIAEIDAQIEAIATLTGMMPNRIAIGLSAWKRLRHNSRVIARQPGAAVVGATMAQVAQMLLNPAIEIRVGILGTDSAKRGGTSSKSIIGGTRLLHLRWQRHPDTFDPSFAKTFTSGQAGVDVVKQWRDDNARSDIYAVDWSADIKVTSAISAKRITVS